MSGFSCVSVMITGLIVEEGLMVESNVLLKCIDGVLIMSVVIMGMPVLGNH